VLREQLTRVARQQRVAGPQVKAHGGVLGAAVCCAENGGDPEDEWTTCERDRDALLDRCRVPVLPRVV